MRPHVEGELARAGGIPLGSGPELADGHVERVVGIEAVDHSTGPLLQYGTRPSRERRGPHPGLDGRRARQVECVRVGHRDTARRAVERKRRAELPGSPTSRAGCAVVCVARGVADRGAAVLVKPVGSNEPGRRCAAQRSPLPAGHGTRVPGSILRRHLVVVRPRSKPRVRIPRRRRRPNLIRSRRRETTRRRAIHAIPRNTDIVRRSRPSKRHRSRHTRRRRSRHRRRDCPAAPQRSPMPARTRHSRSPQHPPPSPCSSRRPRSKPRVRVFRRRRRPNLIRRRRRETTRRRAIHAIARNPDIVRRTSPSKRHRRPATSSSASPAPTAQPSGACPPPEPIGRLMSAWISGCVNARS